MVQLWTHWPVRASRPLAIAAAVAAFGSPGSSNQSIDSLARPIQSPVSSAIQVEVDRSERSLGLTPAERAELEAFYRAGGDAPLWVDAAGRPNRSADDALGLIRHAGGDGLDSADYHEPELNDLSAPLKTQPPTLPADVARFDVRVSSGMLRYLRDLHMGRVDPRALGFRLSVPADHHDFAALLRTAIAGGQIERAAADLQPQLAQYGALRAMLARYRSLAAVMAADPFPTSTVVVRPGDQYGGLPTLYRLLAALGDLPPGIPAPLESGRYDGLVVDAVRRFQLRHGLESDGVLGKRTMVALGVPLTWRVRQIELALERLRWLPHLGDERLVVLNIPMFRMWAWDAIPATGAPSFGMDVIVGRALTTETPVFAEEMREVIFRPYWNVPPSILRHEVLPAIRRDPQYLGTENMEIVRGAGDDAIPVDATPENVADLARGALRVRQRPGPRNSLGLIKFVFPNEENVYMHGTPATALFSRSRRDFSHGCVRVADPVALAEWVLKDSAEWNRERILEAIDGPGTTRVRLQRPIRVLLFYTTAVVVPEDGSIRFAEDIYQHDVRLVRALTRRQASE